MQAYSQTIGPIVTGSKVSELETERCALLAQDWEMGIKNKRYHQSQPSVQVVLIMDWQGWLDDITCVTYWNTGE